MKFEVVTIDELKVGDFLAWQTIVPVGKGYRLANHHFEVIEVHDDKIRLEPAQYKYKHEDKDLPPDYLYYGSNRLLPVFRLVSEGEKPWAS